jgi:hypothetical protein
MYTVLLPNSNHVDQSQNQLLVSSPPLRIKARSWRKNGMSWRNAWVSQHISSVWCLGTMFLLRKRLFTIQGWVKTYEITWLVVWNMAFLFPNSWDDDPIWLSYFSGGRYTRAQPPISFHILRNNNPWKPSYLGYHPVPFWPITSSALSSKVSMLGLCHERSTW